MIEQAIADLDEMLARIAQMIRDIHESNPATTDRRDRRAEDKRHEAE